jgi:predicted permease
MRRERIERELSDELDAYLEALVGEKVAAGSTPEAARRAALLDLGGADQVKERVRDARAGSFLDTLFQDARFGLRILRKNPAFTLIAVLTLCLGIGANTAVFSVVNTVLFRPLPFAQSDRLVMLWQSYPERGLSIWRMSQANFLAYREQARSFEALAAYTRTGYNASGGSAPARLEAMNVSAGFFEVLRVRPRLGRTFRTGEDAPGRRSICVLSHAAWQRLFGGNPAALGRSLSLNNVPTEIVGVMPADFRWPGPQVDLWVPLDLSRERTSPFNLLGIARLRPGVQPATGQSEVTHILRTIGGTDPAFIGSNTVAPLQADLHATVTPLHEAVTGQSRKPLLVLLGSVALVLLIACANVANLLLGRSTARAREISMRFALGASRARVVRQLLTECLLLGAIGCAAGLALAGWGLDAVRRLPLGGIPRLNEVRLDPAVLAFTSAIGLLAALLFGLVPALRLGRPGAPLERQRESRSTVSAGARATNGALVAVQFALSLVLLVGTGLLLKSFHRMVTVEPGFRTEDVLTLRLYVPPQSPAGYENPFASASGAEGVRVLAFYRGVEERLRGLPGVRAAGLVSGLPFTGDVNADGTIVEGHEPSPGDAAEVRQILTASPGYFRALGISLLQGRDFSDSDRADSVPVAIVDQAMAGRDWPNRSALGGRIRFSWDEGENAWMTVIGVVSDIRDVTLARGTEPHLYLPLAQSPQRRMSLVVRTEGEPTAAAATIREAIRGVEPAIPPFDVQSMEQNLGASLFQERFTNVLLSGFAALSLLLAAAGIYGVMSLEVSSRLKELAIRTALGARPREIFGLILRRGTKLAVAGLAAGCIGALALTRLLKNLLFEVTPTDPATYSAVIGLLVAVAILACALPAHRATRVDPIAALRQE